jgi:hypothetical protein
MLKLNSSLSMLNYFRYVIVEVNKNRLHHSFAIVRHDLQSHEKQTGMLEGEVLNQQFQLLVWQGTEGNKKANRL